MSGAVEQGSKYVFPSISYLLSYSSLNFFCQQSDVLPASGTTWCILCMALLYHWVCLTALVNSFFNYILLSPLIVCSICISLCSSIICHNSSHIYRRLSTRDYLVRLSCRRYLYPHLMHYFHYTIVSRDV